jgi:hypothetical protein
MASRSPSSSLVGHPAATELESTDNQRWQQHRRVRDDVGARKSVAVDLATPDAALPPKRLFQNLFACGTAALGCAHSWPFRTPEGGRATGSETVSKRGRYHGHDTGLDGFGQVLPSGGLDLVGRQFLFLSYGRDRGVRWAGSSRMSIILRAQ